MITNAMKCFVDESDTEYFGKKIYSILFNYDGTVDTLTRLGSHSEEVKKYPSAQAFADAHPVQAANIVRWLREHGQKMDDIQFVDKPDTTPITKKCCRCGKTKPVMEFPRSEFSKDGVHSECCECRIKECQAKKLYCSSNHLADGMDIGEGYLRFERCKGCLVGEPCQK
jgi:hypothetical protein